MIRLVRSKLLRNLISRGTAFLVSAGIAYVCIQMARHGMHPAFWLPLAAIAVVPFAFSVIPTRWLYRLNPSPTKAEPSDALHILDLLS